MIKFIKWLSKIFGVSLEPACEIVDNEARTIKPRLLHAKKFNSKN